MWSELSGVHFSMPTNWLPISFDQTVSKLGTFIFTKLLFVGCLFVPKEISATRCRALGSNWRPRTFSLPMALVFTMLSSPSNITTHAFPV